MDLGPQLIAYLDDPNLLGGRCPGQNAVSFTFTTVAQEKPE